jgi:type I restriction enzyme M protein
MFGCCRTKKQPRKNQVQLINGANLCGKMRKSLGSKRNEMSGDDIATITKCFGNFEVVDARELDKPAEAKSNRGRQSANQNRSRQNLRRQDF